MAKIKIILFILFLISFLAGFLSSCLPEQTERRSRNNTESHYLSDEDEDYSESLSDLEFQKRAIREAQERQMAEGQRAVERNIQYLKELERNNEVIDKNRETETGEPIVNEDHIKQLQKEAKDRHFENLKDLLNTEGNE
ncbi:MAG: hypothetical protein OXM55_03210 [Bdellovibrionales bacterium]|nr:hypothetical protein [Bdellovibrionales bacterium]